jgi:two-component system CheB/CheR fusion protein
VAQDPQEAEHASMPRAAIATGMVDWVLPVAEMGPELSRYFELEKRLKLPPEEPSSPAHAAAAPAAADEAALASCSTSSQLPA